MPRSTRRRSTCPRFPPSSSKRSGARSESGYRATPRSSTCCTRPRARRSRPTTPDVGPLLGRRAVVLGVTTAFACSRSEGLAGGSPPAPVSPNVKVVQWDLGPQPWGPGRAAMLVPTWGSADDRFPVVLALHGRGEAVKSPVEGALGWPRDYALVRAYDRMRAPPLRDADYEGLAEPARMAETNAALAKRPFGGLVVVCPWLPDVHSASTADVTPFARFLFD